MYEFEIRKIIGEYKEDDEISLYANGIRITGILIYYDDDCVRIKSDYDGELIVLGYSDIDSI